MAGIHSNAVGYADGAQKIMQFCQTPKISTNTLLDFECNSKVAYIAGQDHVDEGQLVNGSSITFPRFHNNFDAPPVGHWANGEADEINLDLSSNTVKVCQTYPFEYKLASRDYALLQRTGCYNMLSDQLGKTIANRHIGLIDRYGYQTITGSAGYQIGSVASPILHASADSYKYLFQTVLAQQLDSFQICDVGETNDNIVVYLPNDFLPAHLDFFDDKNQCCMDSIRNGIKKHVTPYGIEVIFVHPQFLPKVVNPTTGEKTVAGFWVNRTRFGLPMDTIELEWTRVKRDLWLIGETVYDAFLLDCKAAGTIVTDVKPSCNTVC